MESNLNSKEIYLRTLEAKQCDDWLKYKPITLTAALVAAKVRIVPTTLAAPPISPLILSILDDGFKEMPPLSKVMPLPTSTSGLVLGALL
jgi:hypothetical protein